MIRIIVQIPNDSGHGSSMALEHLRSPQAQSDLGCRSIGNLRAQLGVFQVRNADFAYDLPYQYELMEVMDGDIFGAIARIARFHNDKTGLNFPHGYVEHIEPDRDLWVSAPATAFGSNFTLGGDHPVYENQLQIAAAHSLTRGRDVRIAVIDSGLHPNTLSVASFHDLITPGAAGASDPTGHGTAMATIINALAPDAELHIIRVTDGKGKAKLWDVMAGLSTAVFDCKAHVINLSLGFPHMASNCGTCGVSGQSRSKAFESLLKGLFILQVNQLPPPPSPIVLTAAGNGGSSHGMDYPAAFPETTLAVGALTSKYNRSGFSNHGTAKDLYMMLPGGDDTPDQNGNPTEWIGSGTDGNGNTVHCVGTSPATAYASGLVALYWAITGLSAHATAIIDVVLQHCDSSVISGYSKAEHGVGRLYYH